MKEFILYAVKAAAADWEEEIITVVPSSAAARDKILAASAWARANGFNRLRVSSLDLSAPPPVFGANLLNKKE